MPILGAEPTQFPEGLLANSSTPSDQSGRWWAVYTRSKGEKALARHLHGHGVGYYLPLKQHIWRQNGRTFRTQLPLFPGYVFLHGSENDRVTALESNVISRVLDVPDQQRLWLDLRRVDRMLGSEVEVGPSNRLSIGQPVDITAGPLQGLQGVIQRHGCQLRLVVEVAFLRQIVSVEVEPWMIEPTMERLVAS